MQVKLAKSAGFCMGVRLAMDKVLAIAEKGKGPVYTHGPLIHNRQAVGMLEGMGIRDLETCPAASGGTVLIRAHGVPRQVAASLRQRGFHVVDATCPRVLASQRRVQRRAAEGYTVVIAGDKDHAEVASLVSHAGVRCLVLSTPDEARTIACAEPLCLVAQTTFNEALYGQIADVLRSRFPGVEVVQSICRATHDRQDEVRELATEVEAMVVVGGRHSANTTRLAEIARATGTPTFHVETADDLDVEALAQFDLVGLTAGASTPNWVTRSVLQALEDIGRPVPLGEWMPWRAFAALTRSNFYSALAASALTYASCRLAGIPRVHPIFPLVAFCYIFAVTMLNRVMRAEGDERYLPPRVAFFRHYARPFLAISLLFCGGSLMGLQLIGAWRAMVLVVLAYALGVAYSVRLVPARLRRLLRYARLKDLPASKDIFVALALMGVCVLAPWLHERAELTAAVLVACAFVFVLTFVKATIVDLADMQEDRLQGRETLPIVLGERKTRRLIAGMTLAMALVLAAATAFGWAPSLGWPMLGCMAYLLLLLWGFYDYIVGSDVVCALVSDGALLLAGALALAWAQIA